MFHWSTRPFSLFEASHKKSQAENVVYSTIETSSETKEEEDRFTVLRIKSTGKFLVLLDQPTQKLTAGLNEEIHTLANRLVT